MGAFGEKLRTQREKRGIALDAISNITKISPRMLRALEEEHFDQLPGGVFNKGFVRAYARQVGLDEEETLAEYLTALRENQVQAQQILPDFRASGAKPLTITRPESVHASPSPVSDEPGNNGSRGLRTEDRRKQQRRDTDRRPASTVHPRPDPEHRRPEAGDIKDRTGVRKQDLDTRQSPEAYSQMGFITEARGTTETADDSGDSASIPNSWVKLGWVKPVWIKPAAVVVLVVVLALVWFSRRHHDTAPVATSASLTQPSPLPSSGPSSGTSTSATPSPVAAEPHKSAAVPVSAPGPKSSAPAAAVQKPSSSTADDEDTSDVSHPLPAKAIPPAANAKPLKTFTLLIRAEQTTWVQIIADGKPVSTETLIAPAHTAVRATHDIVVKTGNAAGVSFLLNGTEFPAQGNVGEVKTYSFDAAGLKPTPAAPAAIR